MPHLKWQLNTTGNSQLVSKTAYILSLNSLKQSLKIAAVKKGVKLLYTHMCIYDILGSISRIWWDKKKEEEAQLLKGTWEG